MTDTPVTHALERTSPKGGPFIGTCRLCGATGLRSGAALLECPNPRGLTKDEALIDAIEGNPAHDTPTRAEVEALIAELRERKIVPPSRAPWHVQEVDVVCWKVSIALTALLPLVFTETGETWWQQNKLTLIQLRQANSRAEAAKRRLAEVEGLAKENYADALMRIGEELGLDSVTAHNAVDAIRALRDVDLTRAVVREHAEAAERRLAEVEGELAAEQESCALLAETIARVRASGAPINTRAICAVLGAAIASAIRARKEPRP